MTAAKRKQLEAELKQVQVDIVTAEKSKAVILAKLDGLNRKKSQLEMILSRR